MPILPFPFQPQRQPQDLAAARRAIIAALVEAVAQEPFQARFRKHPHGQPVVGWADRLRSYFWPDPSIGYAETAERMAEIIARITPLAQIVDRQGEWTDDQRRAAVAAADEIFIWGGVPQATPDWSQVYWVIQSALHGENHGPMNSGWTKVAAFATSWLESIPGRMPQTIWDSRVATAIIHRLDCLMRDVPFPTRTLFPELGTVAGRGGTRPRPLVLRWRNGYGRWESQHAGSRLVCEIRNELNAGRTTMLLPDGGEGVWTIRGVEQVLFMDGY